jgi:acetyl esterase
LSSGPEPAEAAVTLDPEIETFTREIASGFARFGPFDRLTPPEARRAAEEVRARWRTGGPRMLTTREVSIEGRHGAVRARIYDPGPPGPKPALVYLHGGGWMIFSIDTHDRVMREYAARAGVIVVGVDYPLSPEVKFPVALEQCIDVVRWLGDHGAAFDVDAARLAIGGDSAGANMALAAALHFRDAGEPHRIGALLLAYGAYDVEISPDAARRYGGPGAVLTPEEMDVFWGHYLPTPETAANPLACPLRGDFAGLPPACLTIPTCDLLSEQSYVLARRLRAADVAVTANAYGGATHSFLEAVSIASIADRALQDGAEWLRRTLGASLPR